METFRLVYFSGLKTVERTIKAATYRIHHEADGSVSATFEDSQGKALAFFSQVSSVEEWAGEDASRSESVPVVWTPYTNRA